VCVCVGEIQQEEEQAGGASMRRSKHEKESA
jgi:hypothetical protein